MGEVLFLFVLTLQLHPSSFTSPHIALSSTNSSKSGQILM